MAGKVSCPSWLSVEARREWKRLAPRLAGLGMLTALDRAAFAALCETTVGYRKAVQAVNYAGDAEGTDLSRLLRHKSTALKDLLRCCGEFGLTPSSRSQVVTTETQAEADLNEFVLGKPQLTLDRDPGKSWTAQVEG